MAQRKLTIKFDAKGDDKLIKAINALARAQKKLGLTADKTGKSSKKLSDKQKLLGQRVERNRKQFGRLQSAIAVYRNKLLLASFAVTLATTAFVRFVKMAGIQEDSVRRLADVFGGKAAVELDKFSSELQKNSVFGDESINVVMAQIGAFGASTEQTKELTQATIDLAAGLGLDLNTAGLLVAKTIGSSTDALTRYGVGADGAIEVSKRIANVVDSVNEKFGGLAKKLSETTSGQLAQASNAFGDLGEELGRALAPMVLSVAKALKFLAENIDAGMIKRFGAAIITLITVQKIWAATTLSNFKNLRRLVVFKRTAVVVIKAYKAGILGTTIAQKAQTVATVQGTKAIKAFTMAMKRNPFGLIAALLGVIALKAADAFGVFDDGTKVLTDAEKQILRVAESEKELIEAQVESEVALQKRLNILQAVTPLQKFMAEQNREITATEIELFNKIEATNEAISEEKRIQTLLKNAYESTLEAKVLSLEADVHELQIRELNNELTADQIDGLRVLEERLGKLHEQQVANNQESVGLTGFLGDFKKLTELENFEVIQDLANKEMEIARQVADAKLAIINEQENRELEALRNTFEYKMATDKQKDAMEQSLVKKHEKREEKVRKAANKRMLIAFRAQQALNISDAIMNTSVGYTAALKMGPIFGIKMATIVKALGAIQIGLIAAQQPPKMRYGGLIAGQRHEQGGTMINAERGEFVMRREAVEAVGIETMNRINQGGSAGNINISFNGNVLSKDFIEDEAIPHIKDAIRRGADIGVG